MGPEPAGRPAARSGAAEMPWFPDFVSAAQLARRDVGAAGRADPAAAYLAALRSGDPRALEAAWPGQVEIDDPLAGVVRGHREVRRFVHSNGSWLGKLDARTERVAATAAGGRAAVELLARLTDGDTEIAWPVAIVAESPDEWSVTFRTYCRPWPLTGPPKVRPPVLAPGPEHPGGVVGEYLAALAAGDTAALVAAYEPDGYLREPYGEQGTHQGAAALRAFYDGQFRGGGGIGLEHGAVTDDGTRCALEFTCVRWGGQDVPPQAGLAVYERGPDGLLAAVRLYHDIAAPG
jgi:hypothetical protein